MSTRIPSLRGFGSGPAYAQYFKQIAKAVVLHRPRVRPASLTRRRESRDRVRSAISNAGLDSRGPDHPEPGTPPEGLGREEVLARPLDAGVRSARLAVPPPGPS